MFNLKRNFFLDSQLSILPALCVHVVACMCVCFVFIRDYSAGRLYGRFLGHSTR